MENRTEEKLLGDFVKGRLLFLEDHARRQGKDPVAVRKAVEEEVLRRVRSPERQAFFREKIFQGPVLSTSLYPEWVDRTLLEAMSVVLQGPGAPLFTTTSERPCITFEAGRYNARRQAETVFKAFFQGKKPDQWLRQGFFLVLRRCYGDAFAEKSRVVETGPGRFEVHIDNTDVPQASRMECSTGVGYLYEGLLITGARDPMVTHPVCRAEATGPERTCVYVVTFR